MSCERHSDAILEHALGEPASLDLRTHLRECEACRSALERERRLVGRIDGELKQSLVVAPSPEFLPRVRASVAAEAERRAAPWLRWLLPLAAVAATLAIGTWLAPSSPKPQPGPAARAVPRPESPIPVPAASADPAPRRATAAVHPMPPRTPLTSRQKEQEVLVPPGQEAALLRFAATLRAGRVDAAALVQPEPPPPPNLGISALAELPSLEVKPLAAESNPEGVIP